MKTSIRSGAVRRHLALPLTLASGVFLLACVSARAADLDPITVSAPMVKVIARDSMTNAPIEEVTATAIVNLDPATLATHSGVELLKDGVRTAALEACDSVTLSLDSESCVIRTVRSAQPQVDAAIARARSNANG